MRSRLSIFAVFTVLGSGLLLAGWMLADARNGAWQRAADNSENLAQALSQDIEHAIETYDTSLQAVQEGMRLPAYSALPEEARRAIVFNRGLNARFFGSIIITDASGNLISASSGRPQAGLNVADRDYFRMQKSAEDNQLFVGLPFRSRLSGQDGLGISRRLTRPDGSFAGVAAGMVRLSYFQDLCDKVRIGRHGLVTVLAADGTPLTRVPGAGSGGGPGLADPDRFRAGVVSGTFEADRGLDHVRRLYAFRHVGGLPLTVVVAPALSTVYAEWWQRALVVALVGLPLMVASGLLGWALSQELDRRERAEQDAWARGAEFRATFDHSADGLFLLRVQPSGRFMLERANAALTRMWSLPVGAMEGREPRSFLAAALVAQMEQHWVACTESGGPERYSMVIEQPNRRMELETVITPVRDEQGRIAMLLGSTRDMTERSDMLRRLAQAQKLEAVGQISAGVTHDFNNLLQTLTIGMREMLAQLPDTDMRRRLRSTLQAVERGVELTRRLLSFSRHKAPHAKALNPQDVIAGCSELVAWTLGPRIELQTVAGAALWCVKADRAQLEMCLLNLAANARDAMPNGGRLLVRARNASAREAAQAGLECGDAVVIAVQDNGTGMDAATRARVFDAFFTTKSAQRGSGLGLWMVRGFARDAGGDVTLDTEPGQGTTISIWLPRNTEAADTQPADLPAPPSVHRSPWHPREAEAGQARILLVDDDQLVLEALARLLQEAGHAVIGAGDALAALEHLGGPHSFDLLIADQSIPGMTGTALVAQAAQLRPDLPVMVITGFAQLDDTPPGVRVLHKPIDADALLAEVAALISPAAEKVDA